MKMELMKKKKYVMPKFSQRYFYRKLKGIYIERQQDLRPFYM